MRQSSRRSKGGTMSTNSENTANNDMTEEAAPHIHDDVGKKHDPTNAMERAPTEPEEDAEEDDDEHKGYAFEGVTYSTYQEMVNAKRQRNQQVLLDSGLLDLSRKPPQRKAAQGLRKRKSPTEAPERRKSNRLAGLDSDGKYVEDERAGRFLISSSDVAGNALSTGENPAEVAKAVEFYRDRINDGSGISVRQAVENIGSKWMNDTSVSSAETFVRTVLCPQVNSKASPASSGPPSLGQNTERQSHIPAELRSRILALNVDDENLVAKVTPDRIYGIAAHPSTQKAIVCAGDKGGYVGIWDVDQDTDGGTLGNETHLFRFHKGAACCLQWTPSGSSLFSASYDGTVRCFDVATETFDEVFATYDSQSMFANKLGYGMDAGHSFWTQYACLDRRYNADKCFFLSTSVGTAMHVDLRLPEAGRVTFHEELSEKKINTVSLHPNGYSLLTAGLDCTVKVWDLRKFQDSRTGKNYKAPGPLASYNCGKSVNSAYFSPSGRFVVTTTMANKLDLFENLHQATPKTLKPKTSIRHDNMTGRWLSTFMATWHPEHDIFVVGSMRKPRCVEVFDAQGQCLHAVSGDALTAVASRCCFHPSVSKLTIVGGNSSGRVTIIR